MYLIEIKTEQPQYLVNKQDDKQANKEIGYLIPIKTVKEVKKLELNDDDYWKINYNCEKVKDVLAWAFHQCCEYHQISPEFNNDEVRRFAVVTVGPKVLRDKRESGYKFVP